MVIPPSRSGRRSNGGIIYSTVLNRTPLPALTFTSYGGLASFLFSPLIGQVFRRECRIGGAFEFTPSSSVVLQSKSCADPLPSRRPLPSILSFSSRFSSFPSARPLLISLARKISSAVTRLRPCLPPSLLKDYRRRVDGSMN